MTKLIFIHMPKCAGRAFVSFFSHYGYWKEINNIPYLNAVPVEEINKVDFLIGHIPFCNTVRCEDFKVITVLRDPLERTISQYNHLMTMETGVTGAIILREQEHSFLDFVKSNYINLAIWVNAYTTFLGDSYCDGTAVFDITEFFENAIRNIEKLDFIGIFEQMDLTLDAMKDRYGLQGDLEVTNKTPEENKVAVVSGEDRKTAKEYLKWDYELYNIAKDKFSRL